MKNYIMKHHGFKKSDMTILMDDGKHEKPTKARILRAYKEVVEKSRPGDSVFCHYSGHGGRVKDKNGDEGKFCNTSSIVTMHIFSKTMSVLANADQ